MSRPMFFNEKPKEPIKSPIGSRISCKTWDTEAAMRMLMNNITPGVALKPDELIVYGGTGRAARNWREYNRIIKALKNLKKDETLCIQSGKPVYIAKTYEESPRVILANSNIVPKWSTQENFDKYDQMGLTMYGQMTAGSWIYIGTQGILQGTYETLAAIGKNDFKTDTLRGKFILTAGMGAMSGAQPMAATMNEAIILDIEVRRERIQQKVNEGYCNIITDSLDEALEWINKAKKDKTPLSIGLVGNAAEIEPELVRRDIIPDIVTDQTSAHDLLSYIPAGEIEKIDKLREENPQEYRKLSLKSIAKQVEAILEMQKRGAIAVDYGNNIRGQAELAGVKIRKKDGSFKYPGFVPAYIRPLFCQGKGPFRWAALSGDKEDLRVIDNALFKTFPNDKSLRRWITMAREKVPVIGLPTRICWLGYRDRAKFGLVINNLVKKGKLKAPIVIGRDHLDCGSVASPNRETEGMKDGSDAIADWPLLNFALNTAAGASWVSFHNGGGVGIGNSLHAGMVIVADGTKERDVRLQRVLTVDPGIGIARHADAGYKKATETAKRKGIKIPEN